MPNDRNKGRVNEGQGFVEPEPCGTCGRDDGHHVLWQHTDSEGETKGSRTGAL